jgi:hypothetical protein
MTMTYSITGLSPETFAPLFDLDDTALAESRAERVTATSNPGFPCRISLEDASVGEELILLHHVSHDVATPYRSAYAIYVRAGVAAATFVDEVPPIMRARPIALRGFDQTGRLRAASLAAPGEADAGIRTLFASAEIAYIHAHNAAHGCFVARVERQ